MASRRQPTDLRGRREDLPATVEAIAAGIGLRAAAVREIESGEASVDMLNHYAQWLGRIEAWPPDKRAQQLLAAGENGRRFNP